MATKAQKDALARMMGGIRKSFGQDSVLELNNQAAVAPEDVIPTGIDVLDRHLLSIGGFKRGKMAEIYGDTGAGKTSLGYQIAGNNQRAGGTVVWVDSEQAFDVERARLFGFDPDAGLLGSPDNLEHAVDIMRGALSMAKVEEKLLVVWDSIATSPTIEELEKDASADIGMSRGGKIGRACRALCLLAAEKKATLIFINQVREKIGVSFGSPFTTPGGKGPKFAASVRMHLMGGAAVKEGEVSVAKDLVFMTDKNRFAPPLRKVRVRLNYLNGWDSDWSTFNWAKDQQLIKEKLPFTAKNVVKARKALDWASDEDKVDDARARLDEEEDADG